MINDKLAGHNWLIEENAAKNYLLNFLSKSNTTAIENIKAVRLARKLDIEAKQPEVYKGDKKKVRYDDFLDSGEDGKNVDGESIYGAIGIVYLRGAMVYESNWCVKGTVEITQEINDFGQNPNIMGVMLVVDSPGGMVKGTELFAQTVRNFKSKYGKKIFAYVEGMACSAAMWAISGADKIILSENTSILGSIGTMVSLADYTEYYKEMGIANVDVYATLSNKKNKDFNDAINGSPNGLIQTILNPTNLVFLSAMQANRGAKMGATVKELDLETATVENTPEVLRGTLYVGKAAVEVGLADKISKEGLEMELQIMQNQQSETVETKPNLPIIMYAEQKTETPKQYINKYSY